MKRLLAIRHAKSDWSEAGLPDHDRPLNRRGLEDAPRMGSLLSSLHLHPDAILTSTAHRARTTALILAEKLSFPIESILENPAIYLASPSTLLNVVQGIHEDRETALIFGHNPGMHELVNQLLKENYLDDFPTLAIAWMELDAAHWGEVDWGCARLIHFLCPKNQ